MFQGNFNVLAVAMATNLIFVLYCSYLEVLENDPVVDRNETLGQFVKSRGYSELFQKAYLVRSLEHLFRPIFSTF
jgi:hypothetical protein